MLSPGEALEKYKRVKEKIANLSVVGIAGPETRWAKFRRDAAQASVLIREYDPDVTFCLSTNGLMLPLYAQELIDLGVYHVTVTVNAVDVEIGAKIYKYVDIWARATRRCGGFHPAGKPAGGITLPTERGASAR